MTAFGTFFLPGPTEVRHEVLAAMTRPMIAHRGAEFEALFGELQQGLRAVFRTARPVYIAPCSATGMMEAAVRCAPQGRILALVNGAFADRFAQVARACGREVTVLDAAWGSAHGLDAVEAELAHAPYAAMTVVHSETSTGVLSDVRALAALAHAHGAMILVDSVTGVAGAPLETDAWGLDFVLTGSQKALAVPPGLALAVATEAFVERAASTPNRGLYFDLVEYEQFAKKNQTPNTPALSLLYALQEQLRHIMAEGIEARWVRHAAMLQMVEHWAHGLHARGIDVDFLAPPGARSPTVSTLTAPAGMKGGDIVKRVAALGFVIGGGYGRLRDTTFRIGHMGDHTPDGLARCLDACTQALAPS
jgi:predicted phosphoserine aminotransferase